MNSNIHRHRAIVRHGDRCKIELVPQESVYDGELILAPEKVSICGTDIQILRGQRDDSALIIGHEGLSMIMAKGESVQGFKKGDRVTVNPTHPSDPSFLLGHNVNGLLQERVKIPSTAVDAGLVTHISKVIPAGRGTLIEPLAVVTYALECLALERPDSLLIVGDGLIGNLASLVVPHVLDSQTPITMMHRGELGFEWTRSFNPRVINVRSVGEAVEHVGRRVALLLATHRSGTEPLLTTSARALGTRLVAAHLVGGIALGSTSLAFPGVDLYSVRTANTGGGWPPRRTIFAGLTGSTVLTGNRGVSTTRLEGAATLLSNLAPGASYDQLITHDCGIEEGVDVLNEMIRSGSRVVNGSLVMRLVISLS